MRALIVPLVLILAALVAFIIWQVRGALETKRRDDRAREKEREQWADNMLKDDDK